MIAQPMSNDHRDVWMRIAAPLPPEAIQWRIGSKPKARDGKFFAMFLAYIDAHFVRERLDECVPGEWDLTLELLPSMVGAGGVELDEPYAFKARLQILGVIREDIGHGTDYKTASTDAFKRAAVRFGIGSELYAMEQNWVEVDSDSKFAKPVVDPGVAYTRKHGGGVKSAPAGMDRGGAATESHAAPETPARQQPAPSSAPAASSGPAPVCPKCEGPCFDNRAENDARAARGEKLRPDWKCRDRSCDGIIWRPKPGENSAKAKQAVSHNGVGMDERFHDDLPF